MFHSRCRYLLILLLLTTTVSLLAQQGVESSRRRARPPAFEPDDVARVFFDDVFARLVGERPKRIAADSLAGATVETPTPELPDTSPDTADADSWSRLISSATMEDEIKSIKLRVDQTVTTPSSFAGRGHQVARLDFSLLAMLFAIIDQYDSDVRWQENASLARDLFARTASNLKAGGSIQVYNEAKKRKQDLDDLVRGSRLQGSGEEDASWENIVDRVPLMQLLDSRFEANLKRWTSSAGDLKEHQDDVIREAELTAAIGAVLLSDGMDDADDDDYRPLATMLRQQAVALTNAARRQDLAKAQEAMSGISRSCVDCHDIYR